MADSISNRFEFKSCQSPLLFLFIIQVKMTDLGIAIQGNKNKRKKKTNLKLITKFHQRNICFWNKKGQKGSWNKEACRKKSEK